MVHNRRPENASRNIIREKQPAPDTYSHFTWGQLAAVKIGDLAKVQPNVIQHDDRHRLMPELASLLPFACAVLRVTSGRNGLAASPALGTWKCGRLEARALRLHNSRLDEW